MKYKSKFPRKVIQKDVAKLKKQVRRLNISNEPKYHDELFPELGITYAVNNTTVVADPAQGQTTQTRIANEISPYMLELRGKVEANYASANEGAVLRLIVIQSKQRFIPNTLTSSITQRLLAVQNTVNVPYMPYDDDNRKHYTVLYDRTFNVNNTNGNGVTTFQKKIRVKRPVRFYAAGTTETEGQIFVCAVSNQAAAGPRLTWYTRLHYKD